MKITAILLSSIGLLLTLVPAFLHFFGQISWNTHAQLMFAGMILWFVFAPIWYFKKT
jgi:hypothetical protein